MSCSAGRPSAAWVSPASSAACARNAVSGSVAPVVGRGSGVHRAGRKHRRVDGEIGFAQEALRGVDELVEIVETVLAVLFVAIVREKAGRGVDVLDRLGQRQAVGGDAHRFDQLDERGRGSRSTCRPPCHPRTPPARGSCLALRAASTSDSERPRADAARRKIHDAQERAVVDRASRSRRRYASAFLISARSKKRMPP